MKPLLVNAHSGMDSWSPAVGQAFFTRVLALEVSYPGLLVCHETHRGRILYNPWATRDMCRAFPSLKLTADLSHFCVVAERVFAADDADWQECLAEFTRATRHIHARVGYAEGPQVRGGRRGGARSCSGSSCRPASLPSAAPGAPAGPRPAGS